MNKIIMFSMLGVLAFALSASKSRRPCHPLGDIGPCTHPVHHAGDIGPCTHSYYDVYGNLRFVHAGDLYPCIHRVHDGDLYPCVHDCL